MGSGRRNTTSYTKLDRLQTPTIVTSSLPTQAHARTHVHERIRHHLDVIAIFDEISDPILRADLIMYLVVPSYDGIYTDVGTISTKPIDK